MSNSKQNECAEDAADIECAEAARNKTPHDLNERFHRHFPRSQEWSAAYDKWVNEYLQLVPRRYR